MHPSTTRSVARYEITAVYSHPDAQVDIILVHGLNGRPDTTWTSPNGKFWPVDLLPDALRGIPANILVYGYNADVYSCHNDRSASSQFIHQHAQTLVTSLTMFRRGDGTSRNPIIWVCHSLGGILVKRALLYSNDIRAEYHRGFRSVFVSTFGIIFLGTPHMGSDVASWGLMLQGMADAVLPRKLFESESVLLRTLKKDCETLMEINDHFMDVFPRFRIHMAHENHKTDIKGTKIIIVDASSASPPLPGVTYYGIEATHSNMYLRAWAYEAPSLIATRWIAEDEEHVARVRNDITERISPYLCPAIGGQMAPKRPLTPVSPLGHATPVSSMSQGGMFLKTPRIFELDSPSSSYGLRSDSVGKDSWSRWSESVFEVEGDM